MSRLLGSYYDFDTSGGEGSKAIMADQLCGLWYLQACGITEPVSTIVTRQNSVVVDD